MGADASAPVPTRLTAIADRSPIRAHGLGPWAFTAKAATRIPRESTAFARMELPARGREDVDAGGQGPEVVREAGVVRTYDLAAADHDRRAAADAFDRDLRLKARVGGVHGDHVGRSVERPCGDSHSRDVGGCR